MYGLGGVHGFGDRGLLPAVQSPLVLMQLCAVAIVMCVGIYMYIGLIFQGVKNNDVIRWATDETRGGNPAVCRVMVIMT